VWRSGDGPKPGPEYLTPREARDVLAAILAAAPTVVRRGRAVTFEQACLEWLRYVEHDRQRTASTVRDYRNTVRRYLLPGFGASTPVASITTEDIDDFREQMPGGGAALAPDDPEDPRAASWCVEAGEAQEVDQDQPGRGRRADRRPAIRRLPDA
jgi:hypothetical protein